MTSPFPGMDPYLEHSDFWSSFHKLLATEIAAQLNSQIAPKYYADIEVRTVFEDVSLGLSHPTIPDAAILDQGMGWARPAINGGLALLDAPIQRVTNLLVETNLWSVRLFQTTSKELVTAIEILSPTNKRRGEDLEEYRRKRLRILRSAVHLVEIDLLRWGHRPGAEVAEPPLDTDYVLVVNRAVPDSYRVSKIWPVALNQPIPRLPIPLLEPDPDVVLDLRAGLDTIYERGNYQWRIDYQQPIPPPQLRPAMATWLKKELPQVATGR